MVAAITLLLGVGSSAAYFVIKRRLYMEFDRSLVQRTVLMAAMIESDDGAIRIEWLEQSDRPPGHRPGSDYFAVWVEGNGEPLAASEDLSAQGLPRLSGTFARPEVREIILPGGRPGRCAGVRFDVGQGLRNEEDSLAEQLAAGDRTEAAEPRMVQLVVAELDTVSPTLAAMRWPLLGLWAGCAVLGGLLTWLIVRGGLRPLDELRIQIGRLQGIAGGARIELPRQPAELEPVTRELNRLLERVDDALNRERTLTSNMAHELRTPIAGLLSTIEVTLNRVRSGAEYQESAKECFEIAKRMNWLVANLLSLARLEAGNVKLQRQPIKVDTALTEWWKPFESRAEERGLRVEWKIEEGARLRTDPEFLRVVVTNLYDNAVSYAPVGGFISIEAGEDQSIAVSNQVGALDSETSQPAFDLFWRDAACREKEPGHAGLGLSLCRRIAALLGGRISAEVKEPQRLFVVLLEMAR
jgi:two-component system heavy metal sensor histidine kinase CusS